MPINAEGDFAQREEVEEVEQHGCRIGSAEEDDEEVERDESVAVEEVADEVEESDAYFADRLGDGDMEEDAGIGFEDGEIESEEGEREQEVAIVNDEGGVGLIDSDDVGLEEEEEECEEIDLDVFFGWESGYNGTEFLVYGLSEEWLMNHPEIKDATVEEQYKLVHEGGGIVFQAHPYREEWYIPGVRLYPNDVDGIEVFNSHNKVIDGVDLYNDRALEYAAKYNFPVTCGSDIHSTSPECCGVAFDRRMKDIHDFINHVMNRECELVKNRIHG